MMQGFGRCWMEAMEQKKKEAGLISRPWIPPLQVDTVMSLLTYLRCLIFKVGNPHFRRLVGQSCRLVVMCQLYHHSLWQLRVVLYSPPKPLQSPNQTVKTRVYWSGGGGCWPRCKLGKGQWSGWPGQQTPGLWTLRPC